MIIWWLFALFALFALFELSDIIIVLRIITSIQKWQSERLTSFRFCQAILPQNTCGQVCTTGKGYLWFAWLLTARSPLCFSMSTVGIVRTQGWEIAIAVNAFVIQKSLCRLALSLTYLAAHPQPQQVKCITFSKLAATRCTYCSLNSNKTRKRLAVADFEEC